MRPSSIDSVLFCVMLFLAAAEGVLLAEAFIATADPLALAKDFQWLATIGLGSVSAALVYRSTMSKTWGEADEKAREKDGIANNMTGQFLAVAYFSYDIYQRVTHHAEDLIHN